MTELAMSKQTVERKIHNQIQIMEEHLILRSSQSTGRAVLSGLLALPLLVLDGGSIASLAFSGLSVILAGTSAQTSFVTIPTIKKDLNILKSTLDDFKSGDFIQNNQGEWVRKDSEDNQENRKVKNGPKA